MIFKLKYLLVFEFFERFIFYFLVSSLLVYLTSQSTFSLPFTTALKILSYFEALCLLFTVISSFVMDRYFGKYLTIIIGLLCFTCGLWLITLHEYLSIVLGLIILAFGFGVLKPSLTSSINDAYLYKAKNCLNNKQIAYNYFYLATLLGAITGPLFIGILCHLYGYSISFRSISIVTLLSLFLFIKYKHHTLLSETDNIIKKSSLLTPSISKNDKIAIYAYFILCITNIFWNTLFSFPLGLITFLVSKYFNRTCFGFVVPVPWIFSSFIILVMFSIIILNIFYHYRQKAEQPVTVSHKLGIAYFFTAISCISLIYISQQIQRNYYQIHLQYIFLFIVPFAVATAFSVPTLLSAASDFISTRYVSILISFNMSISWAGGAVLGGKLNAMIISLTEEQKIITYSTLCFICLVYSLLHYISNPLIEKILANRSGN